MSEITDKLNSLATPSDWIEKANKRQGNKEWLKHSQKIALKVLRTLRKEKVSQKSLAERIGVSPQYVNKIVKGKENLTLETISKLEKALAINLMGAL
ncbi:MAG: helix-turn-helix transcriptional regulator [Bacteroidales bacterium]|nr:helix-turn-helix transcriptional regulator [Bacteroidales bacterium]